MLLLRETPLHAGHIELMAQATRNGAIVMPPVPAFYHRPVTIDDIVNQTLARAVDLLDISLPGIKRWEGTGRAALRPRVIDRTQNGTSVKDSAQD